MKKTFLRVVALASAIPFASPAANASGSFLGDYYKIPASHLDVDQGAISGVVTGMVESTLGPNGLPVATASGLAGLLGGADTVVKDYDGLTREILWWKAGVRSAGTVLAEKSIVEPAPIDYSSNFYPDGESNDSSFFRAVHWSGTFNLSNPGTVTMNLGADDDAWVFVNGQLFIDLGGVHGLAYSAYTTGVLAAGNNKIDVFYADRNQVQAGIRFDPQIEITPSNPVPEPTSMALLGVAAIGIYRRRARLVTK